MSVSDSDEKTAIVTTANTPIRSAKDAALISLALVDFFQHDTRLTCILDTAAAYIAYRNAALKRLFAGTFNLVRSGE